MSINFSASREGLAGLAVSTGFFMGTMLLQRAYRHFSSPSSVKANAVASSSLLFVNSHQTAEDGEESPLTNSTVSIDKRHSDTLSTASSSQGSFVVAPFFPFSLFSKEQSLPFFIQSAHTQDLLKGLSSNTPRPLKDLAANIAKQLTQTVKGSRFFKGVVSFADEYFFQELNEQFSAVNLGEERSLECFFLDCDQWRSSFEKGNEQQQKEQMRLLEHFFHKIENNPRAVVVFKNLRPEDAYFLDQQHHSQAPIVTGSNLGDICHDTVKVTKDIFSRRLEAMLPSLLQEASKVIVEGARVVGKAYLPGNLFQPLRNHLYQKAKQALDLAHASKKTNSSVSPIAHNSLAQNFLVNMAKKPVNALFCTREGANSQEINQQYSANMSLKELEKMAVAAAESEGLQEDTAKQLLALCLHYFGSELKIDIYLELIQSLQQVLSIKIEKDNMLDTLCDHIETCYPCKKGTARPCQLPNSLFFSSSIPSSPKNARHQQLLKKIEGRLDEKKGEVIGLEDPSFERLQAFSSELVSHFESKGDCRVANLNLDIDFFTRCNLDTDYQLTQLDSMMRQQFDQTPVGEKLLCVLPPCLKGLLPQAKDLFEKMKKEYSGIEAEAISLVPAKVDYSSDKSLLGELCEKVQNVALKVLQNFGFFPKIQNTKDSSCHASENFATGAFHLAAPNREEIDAYLGSTSFSFKDHLLPFYEYLLRNKTYNFERVKNLHDCIQKDRSIEGTEALLSKIKKECVDIPEKDLRYYLNIGSFYREFPKRASAFCAKQAAFSLLPSLSMRVIALAGGIFALGGVFYAAYQWMKKK